MVSLNSNESKIFQLLRDCVKETELSVTLRVAGGWVRDKVNAQIKYYDNDNNLLNFNKFIISYWVWIAMIWISQLIK